MRRDDLAAALRRRKIVEGLRALEGVPGRVGATSLESAPAPRARGVLAALRRLEAAVALGLAALLLALLAWR